MSQRRRAAARAGVDVSGPTYRMLAKTTREDAGGFFGTELTPLEGSELISSGCPPRHTTGSFCPSGRP